VQPTLYTAIYMGAAAIGVVSAAVAWRRRTAPGGRPFLLMLAAGVWWCFFDGLESAAVGIPAHVLWAKVAFLGNMTVGVFLLLFALDYTRHHRPRPGAVAALFIIPVIGILGAATNESHHAIWTGFEFVPGGQNLLAYGHGWLAWVVAIYGLALALIAAAALVTFALRAKAPYRRQSAAVIAAVSIPWIAEIIYIANADLFPGIDPSVTFVLSGALMSFGLVRFRLLDLIPIARERLIERMEDGLLVLDAERRILDSNPAAARILGCAGDDWIGEDVSSAVACWPQMADCLAGGLCGEGRMMILSPRGRTISVTIVSLDTAPGGLTGTLITLRDATPQAEVEATLQSMNADLQRRVTQVVELQEELREQALRDSLTGLFNRRYLDATLSREIGRARREGYPVSVVMIDIDRFKAINDEYGHPAGDQVLRFLGAQLSAGMRTGDIACRYGGDEFLLVLPNTSVENARARAEEWRAAVRESSVSWIDRSEPTTLSFGVAGFPEHGATADAVMGASDAALYAAKSSGRDRVVVSDRSEGPEEREGSDD